MSHGSHTLTCMTTLGPQHPCTCPAKDLLRKDRSAAFGAPYGAYKHGGSTLASDIEKLAACHNPEGIQRLSRQSEERSARTRAWQASLAKAADVLMREGHAGDAATMNDIARHLTGED